MAWHLLKSTKNYFIDSILAPDIAPPIVTLMLRQAKFFHSLLDSPSCEVQVLSRLSARDVRSNLGSNLSHIQRESRLDPWIFGGERLKDQLCDFHHVPVPEADSWRIGYMAKLQCQRLLHHFNGCEKDEHLEAIVHSLASS